MGWWVSDLLHSAPVLLVAQIFWVIVSICLHELAHGWAAIRLGDRTPIETGHMTWNPLVHMGPMSLLAFALCGLAWGAMPVNTSRLRGRFAEAKVAAAGPAMNLLIALVAVIVGGLVQANLSRIPGDNPHNVVIFFRAGVFLNLMLAVLNLIPIPPLDGSRIAAEFIPAYRAKLHDPGFLQIATIGLVIAFIFGGKLIAPPASKAAIQGIDLVARLVG